MNESPPPTPTEFPDPALEFFYHGFHATLRRFCRMTIAGWVVAAGGFAGLLFCWRNASPHGLFDIALCCTVFLAGLLVVQQNVAALSAYARVPFPIPDNDPRLLRLRAIMREVDEGGWRDACTARRDLERLHEAEGYPPLR